MVKRAIGMDISDHHICAVQMVRQGDLLHIEKVSATATRRISDDPSEFMTELTARHSFDWRADVAIALPHASVFYTDFKTDAATLDAIRQGDDSALVRRFPLPADQRITVVCTEQEMDQTQRHVLVAAASTEALQRRMGLLERARMTVGLVDAEIFAVQAVTAANYPRLGLADMLLGYLDESHLTLAVVVKGRIVLVHNTALALPAKRQDDAFEVRASRILCREAALTWQKALDRPIDGQTQVVLVTCHGDNLARLVEEGLGCTAMIVNPLQEISIDTGQVNPQCMALAVGLAVRALAPRQTQGLNFLGRFQQETSGPLPLKKELSICGTLVAAIAVVWMIGLVVQASCLESTYSGLKDRIRDVFQKALPDEKVMVSPLTQVREKLKAMDQDREFMDTGRSFHPLEVLQTLTDTRPDQAHIEVRDLFIGPEAIRIQATCQSFDQVYKWQRRLQAVEGIADVEVQDPRKDSQQDRVNFVMIASLAKEDRP